MYWQGDLRIVERADKVEHDVHFLSLLGDVARNLVVVANDRAEDDDTVFGLVVVVGVVAAVEPVSQGVGIHPREPETGFSLDEEEVDRRAFFDENAVGLRDPDYVADDVAVVGVPAIEFKDANFADVFEYGLYDEAE